MSKRQQIKPASFHNIVKDLFQNEKFHTNDNVQYKQTFSQVSLTDAQKAQIVYPDGYTPLNFFIIYQTDKYADHTFVSNELDMVSFVRKGSSDSRSSNASTGPIQGFGDGYIYGYYFDILDQDRYRTAVLKDSSRPVTLSDNARIVPSQYLEVYNDINGSTIILSLSTDSTNLYATLQYSREGRYIYQQLRPSGLIIFNGDDALLTGLSKNLRNCDI